MNVSCWIIISAIAFAPELIFACGNEYTAAYEMTQNGGVQENPRLFLKQVRTALSECDALAKSRSETEKSNELDLIYLANRQNCEQMNEMMKGYNEEDMSRAFCLLSAMRTYSVVSSGLSRGSTPKLSNKELCDSVVEARAQEFHTTRKVQDHRYIKDVEESGQLEGFYEINFGSPFKANFQFDQNCNVTHIWWGW